MKKLILSLVLILSVICFVSCTGGAGVTVNGLEVSGQKTEFIVGEAFDEGEIKVVASLSDGTSLEVTKDAVITEPASLSSVGTYAVIVTYKQFSTSYQINVAPVAAEANLIVDEDEAKTAYVVGEAISAEGAKVYAVSGNTLEEVAISECAVKVVDANGVEVAGEVKVAGTYNVVISYGELQSSYQVQVLVNNYETVVEAIAVAVENASNVKSGFAAMSNYGNVTNYIYEFGQGYLKSASGTDEWGYDTYHYELQEDGSVFGVNEYEDWDGSMVVGPAYGDLTENHVKGVDFSSLLSYSVELYGIEAVASALAELGQSETATNHETVVSSCPSCGSHYAYSFYFEYIYENFYYYCVSVSFGLSASESIAMLDVTVDAYYSEENVMVDENGNVIGKNPEATAPDFTRTLTAVQEDGERTATMPYPKASLVFESYDVVDENGNDVNGSTVNATMGNGISLNVVNAKPETASPSIDEIQVLATDAEGFETYSVYGSYYEGVVTINAYKAGTYTITISSANVEKSFTLVVEPAKVTSFAPAVYDESWWDFVEKSEVNVYTNVSVEFRAIVNEGADAGYTAALKVASENAEVSEVWEAHQFVATVPGTYVVVLTSTADATFTAELTINVEDAPSVAEMLTGTYTFESGMFGTFKYVFSPDAEGATSGTCAITAPGNESWGAAAVDVVVKYSYTDGWLSVTTLDGMMPQASFDFDTNYNLICIYNGYEQGILVKEGSTPSGEISGTYTYSMPHPMVPGMTINYQLTFNADGTGSYDLKGQSYYGTFTYVAENGVITFSDVTPLLGTNPVTLTATYEGDVVTATYYCAEWEETETNEYVK